ncbi:hypothetical protein HPC62_20750 [Thermoleptolyngbya sichuanensis A183]|uniref:Biotin/lipoyl-binding protein n=1 Tax=Thermoleptolyngbya sichuanensis A183 TaxID=2737172 RepID=A0A6M8BJF5_9CYAN|nr:hypothetical protein [Thermoleptolyngbya sichuanensis]QKD84280.1 hypothetical protein HPC62_20750 [Thermoleptolyngbya sichuanensis A183]
MKGDRHKVSVLPDEGDRPKMSVLPDEGDRPKMSVLADENRVSEGQLLAYMDDSNLQGELVQVQGQLDAVQARLARSQTGNRPQEIA